MTKKILWFVFFVVFLAGSCCAVWLGVELINKNKEIDNLYTEEEMQEKYSEYVEEINGHKVIIDDLNNQLTIVVEENEQHEITIADLNVSLSEKTSNIEILEMEIASLNQNITELNSQIVELDSQIATLNADKENNLAEIESLTNQKTRLENDKSSLQDSLTEKTSQIVALQADKDSLTAEVDRLSAEVTENESLINCLNATIASLQAEVDRLTGLLAAYEKYENQSVDITYYVDNTLFDTQVVTRGETTSQSKTPEDCDKYSFVKWQIDGVDFDFATYEFTLNTRVDALLNYNIYDVEFIYNDEEYLSCDVYGGEYVTTFVAPIVEDSSMEYKGVTLSLENVEYIDLSTYKIMQNETFYIVVDFKYTSIQNFDSANVQSEYSISSADDFVKLSELSAAGNSFEGVTIYQVADIDMSSITTWNPIKTFKGNFNGLENSIKNFTITTVNSSASNVGLFTSVEGTSTNYVTIENLVFEDVNISVQTTKQIAVLGLQAFGANVKNVKILSGSVRQGGSYSSKTYMSVMFNSNNSVNYESCINYAEFYARNGAGNYNPSTLYVFGGSMANVEYLNCINYGNLSAKNVYLFDSVSANSVVNCENYGTVTTL